MEFLAVKLQRFTFFISEVANKFSDIAILFAVALMFGVTAILVSALFVQISFLLGIEPYSIFSSISEWLLSTFGIARDELSQQQYLSSLSVLTGAFAVLVTLWFSLTTAVNFIKYKRKLEKRSIIRKRLVIQDGTDDLKIMHEYYKKADFVVVFSGDFSWLNQNQKLWESIRRLASARKISLVSYKDESHVEDMAGDAYRELKPFFHFAPQKKLKCSLVKINQNLYFLYKVDETIDGSNINICVLTSRAEANYLLETLSNLCGEYLPG